MWLAILLGALVGLFIGGWVGIFLGGAFGWLVMWLYWGPKVDRGLCERTRATAKERVLEVRKAYDTIKRQRARSAG